MAKKTQLSHKEIENRLKLFKETNIPIDYIGFHLLYCFGKTEADIRRYREGKGILKTFDGLLVKGLFCYRSASSMLLTQTLEELKDNPQVIKAAPNIITVSDGETILAYDTDERETFERSLNKLCYDYDFFYPLMGVKKYHPIDESPADRKAAEKLAKLHDELRAYNEFSTESDLHDLNIFIARLLFCFFAEDSGIFEKDLFTSSIIRYTNPDGSDISKYLDEAFNIMDLKVRREDTSKIISQFPYVNGGLFAKHIQIPRMGQRARKIIIECGELDWQDINPDIFGSMIQAVVNPEERANQGMHYTSVPNILKVINPLFLDELRSEYQRIKDSADRGKRLFDIGSSTAGQMRDVHKQAIKSCNKLLTRMSNMRFFDPACGSGNFLIITYKMLRILEMDIFKLIEDCSEQKSLDMFASCIKLEQFYGIELLDFPHEVAMLSLWLAEHQMNVKLFKEFGVNTKALPLHNITQIVCGNACRLDWNTVCPHTPEEEVYIFGNPPYLGSSMQDLNQKADLEYVCGHFDNYKNLDYIAIWFYLAAKYISDSKAKSGFVTTNSICQGDSVALLWPYIFKLNVEIAYAYQSFKWSNNAKYNAGVTCNIIGLQVSSNAEKYLFDNENKCRSCNHINAYLIAATNIIVGRRNGPISDVKNMVFGNKPSDGGFLILTKEERAVLLSEFPQADKIIKAYQGADTFINGIDRYCLWITDSDVDFANSIPPIAERLKKVSQFRRESKAESTVLYADRPHLFKQRAHIDGDAIIVPRVSSETREYVPVGFVNDNTIIADSAQVVYEADVFTFGFISNRMHMVWLRAIGGKLKTDYRYSSLVYNSFPFPKISETKHEEITEAAEEVLITREGHPSKTLADLYAPEKMPEDLREAHHRLDDIVESCYPSYPFASDEARLESLFKLYEKMVSK